MDVKKKHKGKLQKVYFTKETEEAIIRYNESENPDDREEIFRSYIHAPLDKLAENVINRFKFPYIEGSFEEIKAQVVSFLVLNLHKYTRSKGMAFSYFSVIAKNYLIYHNNNAYREEKRSLYISDAQEEQFPLDEMLVVDTEESENHGDMRGFIDLLVQYWDFNITRTFKKKRDIEIANAVVQLMQRIDHLENLNKKAIYLMVREMTNHKTAHITKVINKMKIVMLEQLKEYKKTGHISDPAMFFKYEHKNNSK
jgi:hypothetical protein